MERKPRASGATASSDSTSAQRSVSTPRNAASCALRSSGRHSASAAKSFSPAPAARLRDRLLQLPVKPRLRQAPLAFDGGRREA